MTSTCHARGGAGTQFTYAELEGLWINAGGAKSYAPLMAAIAMAESQGCSSAQNPGGACGLWQINPPQGGCFIPAVNAKMAVAKFTVQGLDAWQTYTSGAYKQYLHGGVPANLNTGGILSGGDVTGGEAAASCLIAAPQIKVPVVNVGIAGGFCVLSKSEARAMAGTGIMIGGFIVMGLGLILLAAYGLKSSGALKAAGAVPGAGQVIARAARRGTATSPQEPARTPGRRAAPEGAEPEPAREGRHAAPGRHRAPAAA